MLIELRDGTMCRMMSPALLLAIGLLMIPGGLARADVTDSSATGFTSQNSVSIMSPRDSVYSIAVGRIASWWDPEHTWSGSSGNLSIEDMAGGLFREDLDGGGSVVHLTVVFADRGRLLRFQGGLGPLQSMAVTGSLTWEFATVSGSTHLTWTYAVTGYAPGGIAVLAGPVDGVLRHQLQRLKRYIESGTP